MVPYAGSSAESILFEESEYSEEEKQMPAHDRNHESTRSADALDVMGRFESMLDHWRAHVDEFLVQVDLAHMEIRDMLTNFSGVRRGTSRHIWTGGSTSSVAP